MTAGIAMWHFQTEFSLKLNRNGEYKNLISVQETQGYIYKSSNSIAEFDRVFRQLKVNHTIIGLYISNSDVSSGA